jgi:aldehyde dehydrogenase (NAD+)
MSETLTHFIGGERVSADAPQESLNPSDTTEVVARVPSGGQAEVDAAVSAARTAFPPGRRLRRRSAPTCWTRLAS